MIKIPLSRGIDALVDDKYEYLLDETWHANYYKNSSGKICWYASHTCPHDGFGEQKKINLAREVMVNELGRDLEPGEYVDHINFNALDNRTDNLRLVSNRQNCQHRQVDIVDKSSRYKGVTWRKDRSTWRARIRVDGRLIDLGTYHIEEDAAIAYNEAAVEYFKEFAELNKIKESV